MAARTCSAAGLARGNEGEGERGSTGADATEKEGCITSTLQEPCQGGQPNLKADHLPHSTCICTKSCRIRPPEAGKVGAHPTLAVARGPPVSVSFWQPPGQGPASTDRVSVKPRGRRNRARSALAEQLGCHFRNQISDFRCQEAAVAPGFRPSLSGQPLQPQR